MKNVFWNYGNQGAKFSATIATVGTALNALLGGFDVMIKGLILLMAVDFILGILAAIKDKKLDSHVMLWGGVNKVLVLSLVGVGVVLDSLLGISDPYIRTTIIWFYIGREGLSLFENYGKMGMPLPAIIKDVLNQIQDKGNKVVE